MRRFFWVPTTYVLVEKYEKLFFNYAISPEGLLLLKYIFNFILFIFKARLFMSWFTNPPTVIFQKVEKNSKTIFLILSPDSKYYVFR